MTDGDYWPPSGLESFMPIVANEDGTHRRLPDGTLYAPHAPYADNFGRMKRPTLADLTFEYWARDLQPGVPNNLKKIIAEPGDVTVGRAKVPEYWNPKNDPATWQHLTTHFIGFGAAGDWWSRPKISTTALHPTYSGDYAGVVDGSIQWLDPFSGNARMDLWHAALNSRGTFTPASNAKALSSAFKSILGQVLVNTGTPLTSISASASRVSTGTSVYQAGYDTADWSGRLSATKFGTDGRLAAKADWSARDLLDTRMASTGAHDRDRVVLSFSGTTAASAGRAATTGAGVPFRWAHLGDAQRAALKAGTDTDAESTALGRAVLDFLRGDRSNEGAGRQFRKRGHVLGDIVGSSVWYAGQPKSGFTGNAYAAFAAIPRAPMVYVGANDGMLHAFNASTGKEAFAYVPEGLYGTAAAPNLKRLSEGGYTHRYYVDGSAFVADIYMGPTSSAKTTDEQKAANWKSLLVGTLGAGGKGYFVLDATRPESVDEGKAASVALIDTTALADDDLGHQFQQPALDSFSGRALQVAQLSNDRKALILGNGYNSKSEKAVLWIQYLDGDKAVLKIPAPVTQEKDTGNGLSAPRPVDLNGDGKVDLVYAGDLLGNLWKFDLGGTDSRQWKATMGPLSSNRPAATGAATPSGLDNKPLFAAGASQPITTAPVVVGHPRGGYMVVFGTGRLFASGDERSTADQYLYGIWDPVNGSSSTATRNDLVVQTIGATPVEEGDAELRTVSHNAVSYTGSEAKRGWHLKLPASGERVVYPGDVLTSGIGLFSSTIPGSGSNSVTCTAGTGDDGWSLVIDFFSGSAPEGIAYSTSGAVGAYAGFRNRSGKDDMVLQPKNKEKGKDVICNAAGECKTLTRPDVVRRFGWRSLMSTD
jgi:type IV pilus assembly protein PilY1